MPPFEEGHTSNVGKTYDAAKVKRMMKRSEKRAVLEALKPEDLRIAPPNKKKERDYAAQTATILANRGPGLPKGHPGMPGAGRQKKTGSIKLRIIHELKKENQTDAMQIARRLINMAKAGDLKAIEMVMERVDGKVPSTIGGDKDNPLTIIVEPVIASRYSNPILSTPVIAESTKKDANPESNDNLRGSAPIQSN